MTGALAAVLVVGLVAWVGIVCARRQERYQAQQFDTDLDHLALIRRSNEEADPDPLYAECEYRLIELRAVAERARRIRGGNTMAAFPPSDATPQQHAARLRALLRPNRPLAKHLVLVDRMAIGQAAAYLDSLDEP